jgi:hypothetical protein
MFMRTILALSLAAFALAVPVAQLQSGGLNNSHHRCVLLASGPTRDYLKYLIVST